jgi:hypothetical protein
MQGCGEMSPDQARRRRDDIIAAERRAVAEAAKGYVDTGSRLCVPSTGCNVYVGETLAYRDGAHLSVAGSQLFTEDLRAALAPLMAADDRAAR